MGSVIEHVHPDPHYVNAVREFYERRPDQRISFLEVRNKCGITHGQCDEAHRLLKRRGEIVAVSFAGGHEGGTYRLTTEQERQGKAESKVQPEDSKVVPIRAEHLQHSIEAEQQAQQAQLAAAQPSKKDSEPPEPPRTYRPCNDKEVFAAIRLLTAGGQLATAATIADLTGFDPNSVGACLSEAMRKNLMLYRKKIPNPRTGGRGKTYHYWFGEQPEQTSALAPAVAQPPSEPKPAEQQPQEAAKPQAQPAVSHDLPKVVTLSLYARIKDAAGDKLNKYDYQAIQIAFGLSEDDIR